MKKLLIIIPFAMGAAACVPVYGANAPRAGSQPYPYRGPYAPTVGIALSALPIGRWDNATREPS